MPNSIADCTDETTDAFFDELQARFSENLAALNAAQAEANDSENDEAMKIIRSSLSDIMKVFYDCQNCSRGIVQQGASVDHIRWLLLAMDATLRLMEDFGL